MSGAKILVPDEKEIFQARFHRRLQLIGDRRGLKATLNEARLKLRRDTNEDHHQKTVP